MSKRLYVAYGSNLNLSQMKYRCPTAKLFGTGIIKDYELQFKGSSDSAYATIAPKKGASVPAAIWEIQPEDETALDRYEGYPSFYFKQDVPVQYNGGEITAMVYLMNLKMQFGLPSLMYYETVYEGYVDCELDTSILDDAVRNSRQRFYSSVVRRSELQLQGLFHDGEEEKQGAGCTEGEQEEMDASDSFYSSDGMQL